MRTLIAVALCSHFLLESFAIGGEFKNLGFDEADTAGLPSQGPEQRPYGPADPAKVLQGWELHFGEEVPYINVNETELDLYDYAALGDWQAFPGFTEGAFALRFLRGREESPAWILVQTGTVPPDTQYLSYRKHHIEMQVRIDGQSLAPLNPPELIERYSLTNLVYDVSQFAGREVKLEFVGPFEPNVWPERGGLAYMDSVAFHGRKPKIDTITSGWFSGTNRVGISFFPMPGKNMVVEFREALDSGEWQPLPEAPHNSGSVQDESMGTPRFYRLKMTDP